MMNISNKEVNICFGVEGKGCNPVKKERRELNIHMKTEQRNIKIIIEQNIRIVQNKLTDRGLGQIFYFNQF